MSRRAAAVERVTQRIDEDLLTDLEQHPSQIRRWFTDNFLQRALSYLVGLTAEKKAKMLRCSEDGALLVKQAGGTVLTKRIFTFDSEAVVEYFFPHHFKRFRIADLQAEQGTTIFGLRKAAKITLAANEQLDIPLVAMNIAQPFSVIFGIYVEGTCELSILEKGLEEKTAVNQEGISLPACMLGCYPAILRLKGGSSGGAIYIAFVVFEDWQDSELRVVDRYYYEELSGFRAVEVIVEAAESFAYGRGEMAFAHMLTEVEANGSDEVEVGMQIYSQGEWKSVKTVTTSAAEKTTVEVVFPVKFEGVPRFKFSYAQTAGFTKIYRQLVRIFYVDRREEYKNPVYEEYTKSRSESGVATFSVATYDRLMKLRNIKAEITIASGGGSVRILINGNPVTKTITESGTYSLPDIEDVYKVEAEIEGDGTNDTTLKLSYLAEEGAYLVGGES